MADFGGARIHAFADDALGDYDGVGVAERIRSGEISADEAVEASRARLRTVNGELNAVAFDAGGPDERDVPGRGGTATGPFSGVPSYVKDNVPVAGMPTGNGSAAYTPTPAPADGVLARELREAGLVLLGKSTLPEFGFNASTEWMGGAATRNPWNLAHSSGASSGGSAALVASGVVPLAHGNDGGGSLRIPAAACGLVGLKPTRGRAPSEPADRMMPVPIATQGVLTRTVRDTAAFLADVERRHGRARGLPAVGAVTGPGRDRLRIGVFTTDIVPGGVADATTCAAVADTAQRLEGLGHQITEVPPPVSRQFVDDFALYWGVLASLVTARGKRMLGRDFDTAKLDTLTLGLRRHLRRRLAGLPGALWRLRRSGDDYASAFTSCDVILSPVVAHTTPKIGYLSPDQPFESLFRRLLCHVAYTPANNACGGPGIALPQATTDAGLPIGVHFSAPHGAERTLLELAFELEQAKPFPRLGAKAVATSLPPHRPRRGGPASAPRCRGCCTRAMRPTHPPSPHTRARRQRIRRALAVRWSPGGTDTFRERPVERPMSRGRCTVTGSRCGA